MLLADSTRMIAGCRLLSVDSVIGQILNMFRMDSLQKLTKWAANGYGQSADNYIPTGALEQDTVNMYTSADSKVDPLGIVISVWVFIYVQKKVYSSLATFMGVEQKTGPGTSPHNIQGCF